MIIEIRYTNHALDQTSRYCIDETFVRKIIENGEQTIIGKRKVKFVFRSKNKIWAAICGKIEGGYLVITVARTKVR
jgi:hypothetical protein